MRILYSHLIKKINDGKLALSKTGLFTQEEMGVRQAVLVERWGSALTLGEAILKIHSDLKGVLKSNEVAGHLGLLKLKLAMYKLFQKFGKSLLDKMMIVELQQNFVQELSRRINLSGTGHNLILLEILQHSL